MSDLLSKRVRWFWYKNTPGTFKVGDYEVTREQIQKYGGPIVTYNSCQVCQRMEWLSRVFQRDLFEEGHECRHSKNCRTICQRQGDELWTHYHQNFWFAQGLDPRLPAPRAVCIFRKGQKGARLQHRYFRYVCDQWMKVLSRQFTQACTIEIFDDAKGIDWRAYDFLFLQCHHHVPEFTKPPIPIVMYGHDLWDLAIRKDAQKAIDRLQPEWFLTPFLEPWRTYYKFPSHTRFQFYPLFASDFFTRSNLGRKRIDLLVLGTKPHAIYEPRRQFLRQIQPLARSFLVDYVSHLGYMRNVHEGAVQEAGVRYLNKYSEYIGLSRYVVFGPISEEPQPVLMKYYECLGSGAIPIMPEAPDLKYLGIEPMKHYIPFSEIDGNNSRLEYFLVHYGRYKHIAERAVEWHRETADRMLFDGFENFVQEVTGHRYPKRLTVSE